MKILNIINEKVNGAIVFLEKADSFIFGRFDKKLEKIAEKEKYVEKEKVKDNHDYIVDYMTAGSKEEMDIALSHVPKNYPFS